MRPFQEITIQHDIKPLHMRMDIMSVIQFEAIISFQKDRPRHRSSFCVIALQNALGRLKVFVLGFRPKTFLMTDLTNLCCLAQMDCSCSSLQWHWRRYLHDVLVRAQDADLEYSHLHSIAQIQNA
jgi:hypothetical protein